MSDNSTQKQEWTEGLGARWANNATDMEQLFAPLKDALLFDADPRPGDRLLEIGCGAGGMTAKMAARVGPSGHVHGIDISPTLKAVAEATTRGLPNVTFDLTDAQSGDLGAGHDAMISSFGMMFFTDPLAGFRNIGRALRPGARITFLSWTEPPANPWFAVNRAVAEGIFGPLDTPEPDAPGPFAFQHIDRVLDLMRDAGLREVEATIEDIDLPAEDAAHVAELAYKMGPSYALSQEADLGEDEVMEIIDRLTERFAMFEDEDGMRLPTRTVLYSARVPG